MKKIKTLVFILFITSFITGYIFFYHIKNELLGTILLLISLGSIFTAYVLSTTEKKEINKEQDAFEKLKDIDPKYIEKFMRKEKLKTFKK